MNDYDVVVIGGDAAGLSGAIALARFQRSVLLLDAGDPRNSPAGHVHNFLTRDGVAPAELYAAGREELAAYGGRVEQEPVTALRRRDNGFQVLDCEGIEVVRTYIERWPREVRPPEKVLIIVVQPDAAHRCRCPECGTRGKPTEYDVRRWRTLDVHGKRTFIESRVPRISCPEHGKITAAVPWAAHADRFTAVFAQHAAWAGRADAVDEGGEGTAGDVGCGGEHRGPGRGGRGVAAGPAGRAAADRDR